MAHVLWEPKVSATPGFGNISRRLGHAAIAGFGIIPRPCNGRLSVISRPDVLDLIDKACQRPPSLHAGNNVTGKPEGNSAAIALRRLRKDRPDLHAQVLGDGGKYVTLSAFDRDGAGSAAHDDDRPGVDTGTGPRIPAVS